MKKTDADAGDGEYRAWQERVLSNMKRSGTFDEL